MNDTKNKTALITGASKGFGLALAQRLAIEGWRLLINARHPDQLLQAKQELEKLTEVVALSGDVRDEVHLLELTQALEQRHWKLSLVVNNASALGPSPLQPLLNTPVESLHMVLHTNMIAPISLLQRIRPYLLSEAKIINISSDAGVEAYRYWGAYGGSKAGLDHMTTILGEEHPEFYFYAFDPGDMRTDMHQAAFVGEDISDRPLPEEIAVPAMVQLINSTAASGRYTASSLELQTP